MLPEGQKNKTKQDIHVLSQSVSLELYVFSSTEFVWVLWIKGRCCHFTQHNHDRFLPHYFRVTIVTSTSC